jgi:hypothetical protein
MDYLVWGVFRWGIVLVLTGMIVLVVIIPLVGKLKPLMSVRTEFFSARAAYWCIIAGLGMLLIMSVSIATRFAIICRLGGR